MWSPITLVQIENVHLYMLWEWVNVCCITKIYATFKTHYFQWKWIVQKNSRTSTPAPIPISSFLMSLLHADFSFNAFMLILNTDDKKKWKKNEYVNKNH